MQNQTIQSEHSNKASKSKRQSEETQKQAAGLVRGQKVTGCVRGRGGRCGLGGARGLRMLGGGRRGRGGESRSGS